MESKAWLLLREWQSMAEKDGSAECWRSFSQALWMLVKAENISGTDDGMITARLTTAPIDFGVVCIVNEDGSVVRFAVNS